MLSIDQGIFFNSTPDNGWFFIFNKFLKPAGLVLELIILKTTQPTLSTDSAINQLSQGSFNNDEIQ
jgi:ABC-type sugar transport system substrate-binding protein